MPPALPSTAFAPRTAPDSPLRAQARLPPEQAAAAGQLALRMAGTLRQRNNATGRAGIVPGLLQEFALSSQEGMALMCLRSEGAGQLALRMAGTLRKRNNATGRAGIVPGLLQEFALSSQEGMALMCLAEALLRIPDR